MSRAHPLLRKWFVIFIILLMIGVVGAGLAVGALLGYIDKMPPLEALENYNPPEITRIFDRTQNTQIAEYFDQRRELIRLKDVPQHVVDAFIAIEDERFYRHFGIDMESIGRAIKVNFEAGGKAQGASTITMQVARNVVLLRKEKKLSRKIREILTALQIEHNYSKEQILEFYLNHIYFGARAYGLQAASKAYFNKDMKDLSIPEAAVLAGLPKAPSELSPFKDKEKARDRRNLVLGNMRRLGYIKTDDELDRFKASPIDLDPAARPTEQAPYYADYVRSLLMKDNSMEQSNELGQKGYSIVSCVDLTLQQICEEELSKGLRDIEKVIEEQKEARYGVEASELGSVREGQARLMRIREVKDASIIVDIHGYRGEIPLPEKLPYFNPGSIVRAGNLIDIYISDIKGNKLEGYLYDKTHVQGGAVLLDVKSGELLAIVGGDDFTDPVNNGQWNRAAQGGRQPGSCWKPLLYSSSFDIVDEEGKYKFTPGYVIEDSPISFPNGWSPKNYEGSFSGPTALHEALVRSRNVPTVKLFVEIGAKKAVTLYNRFNIIKSRNWDLPAIPAMSLGTPDITPLELTTAYASFANGGVGTKPFAIKRIKSSKNPEDTQILKPERTQILSPQAAYMTTRILKDVVAMGTAQATVGKWVNDQTAQGRKLPEIAGKTGTTNNCFVAWFVGFTPDLALGLYVGYDQHRSMGPKIVGGKDVGPIWVRFMDRILQTRTDWKMKFDVPPGITFCDICSKSGKRVTASCYASGSHCFTNAAFRDGAAPTQSCDYHGGSSYYGGQTESGDPEGSYDVGRESSTIGPRGQPLQPQSYSNSYGASYF